MIEGYSGFEHIADGGFSTVYRALSPDRDEVAVKVLRREFSGDLRVERRLRREEAILARLGHRAVPCSRGLAVADGRLAIVMDLVRGVSLREHCRRSRPEWRTVAAIGEAIADVLAKAHEAGVIHRDINPSNVMLAEGEEPPDGVRVLDFGVAFEQRRTVITAATRLGTEPYVPFEQLEGQPEPASDLYALGVTLFEALAGRLPPVASAGVVAASPFDEAPSVCVFAPDVPATFDGLLRSMLAPDWRRRPATARDVARRLAEFIGRPTPTAPGEVSAASVLRGGVEELHAKALELRARRQELEARVEDARAEGGAAELAEAERALREFEATAQATEARLERLRRAKVGAAGSSDG